MALPDTRLAVYQGSAVGALTLVARNDDQHLGEPRSFVEFDAVAGQHYHVQVGDAAPAANQLVLLRWFANPPQPPQATACDDPANFVANPSLEADATGWSGNAASVTAGDQFQRILGDAAHGWASAEIAVPAAAGRGLHYAGTASHRWDGPSTIRLWLRVVGGVSQPIAVRAKGNGVRLVPTASADDYTVTPGSLWQEFALTYQALPGQQGPLTLDLETTTAEAGALVLRADCLQASTTPAAPSTPANLACSPSRNEVRLTWDSVPGADGYYVRVNAALVRTTTGTTVVLTGLTPSTTYTIGVSAFSDAGGESAQSSITCLTTAAPTTTRGVDPSCDPLGFLELNGREIANEARVAGYLRAGLGGGFWQIDGASCGILTREMGLVPRDPAIDPAPWYDPARPESGDFLGVWPQLRVQRQTSRQVQQRITGLGGAVIGPQRPGPVEVRVTASLLARSSGGADYGRRWLEGVLRQVSCDPCGLGTLRLRLACPPTDGTYDELGEVFLYDVALASDVQEAGGGTQATAECCGVQDLQFTLTAGESSVYHRTQLCAQGVINADPGHCVDFCLWWRGPADGSYASSVACPVASPALFGSVGVIATITASGGEVAGVEIALYAAGSTCPPAPGVGALGVVSIPSLPSGSVLVYDSARRVMTFYPTAADAAAGTNAQPGIRYVSIPEGQGVPWLEAGPCQPAGCIVVGKRSMCGASATVRIDTQLREA